MINIVITKTEDISNLKIDDLTGQKIGPYLVKSYAGRGIWNASKKTYNLWNTKCDCGSEVILKHTHLTQKENPSCICDTFNDDYEKYKSITNRHKGIINKCYNQDAVHPNIWKLFGGRVNPVTQEPEPILVCDEWHNKYQFGKGVEKAIGLPPSKGWTLSLIDKSKSFSPENVQWSKNTVFRLKDSRSLLISLTVNGADDSKTLSIPVHQHLVDLIDLSKLVSDLLEYPVANDDSEQEPPTRGDEESKD